jgi:hypothetical protein
MSRVEQIESEIQRMSADELALFRAWFEKFDAETWDRQFERDVQAGKLDAFATKALREHEDGLSTKL